MVETTSEEQNKVKRMKITEDRLRDHWDNIKCTNILIIGVPEEEKKKRYEKRYITNKMKRNCIESKPPNHKLSQKIVKYLKC